MRDEAGVGLVELLIAMTIMAIGISAIVAGFSSGVLAINRASKTATAGTLADRQMEAYRALAYASASVPTTLSGTPVCTVSGSWTPGTTCAVQKPVVGPDKRKYEVDTTISLACPLTGSTLNGTSCENPPGTAVSRAVKSVLVVVKGCTNTTCTTTDRTWFSETSTFDQAT